MLKRSMILLLVLVMMVSFSAAVLADNNENQEEGKAPKNEAGVEILVENDDGDREIHFMDAVNENAKDEDKGNPDHPSNPILVAGD